MNKTINTVPQDNNSGDEDKDVFDAIFPRFKSSHPDKRHEKTARRPDHGWWWNNGIHTATLLAVLAYTTVAALQWKANEKAADSAKSAADTAAGQLELSERPWIKIVDVAPYGDLAFTAQFTIKGKKPQIQPQLQVIMRISNIGHSVADVTPDLEFFAPPIDNAKYWNRVHSEEERFCGEKAVNSAVKFALFPDEPQPFEYNGGPGNILQPDSISTTPQGTSIFPALIVCVSYQHKGLPGRYQTRAVYEIGNTQTHSHVFEIGPCDLRPFPNTSFIFCEGGRSG